MKDFPLGIEVEDLRIESGMINDIKLEDLVTKHQDESLSNISVLKGNVFIKNLFVHGKFNGYNITELDDSLVKLTGEQFVESTLIFQDEINVQNLQISDKLSGHKAEDYLYTPADNRINWDVNLGDIVAENVIIVGNFSGDVEENNFTDIANRILRYTVNQSIESPFEIRVSEVETLEANKINGVDFGDTLDMKRTQKQLVEKLSKGLIDVESKYQKLIHASHLSLYFFRLNNNWLTRN